MFTGIIEHTATIVEVKEEGTNVHFCLESSLAPELHIDQSISHDGVCLTVTAIQDQRYWVTAVQETLKKTNLSTWQPQRTVNLERSMVSGGRFDGHIVQGHVDVTGTCTGRQDQQGSWLFHFEHPKGHATVEKGSICINGVSLTCFNSTDTSFSVTIIPYTFEHTGFKQLQPGEPVNLEFDIIGKYVERLLAKTMNRS